MAAFIPKRRARGQRIIRTLADMADIRTPADLFAFFACGALVALLAVMALFPREFYAAVMGVFL